MNKIQLKIILGLILFTITGMNIVQIAAVNTIDVEVELSSQLGATIDIQLDYDYINPVNENTTLAVYVIFTVENTIDAAMLFFHCNGQTFIYWTLDNPQTNPWFWLEGSKDQHYTFDNSTINLNFVEYSGITSASSILHVFAKQFTDDSFNPSSVDFPYFLRVFPTYGSIYIPPSDTSETTIISTEQTSTTSNTTTVTEDTSQSSITVISETSSKHPDTLTTPWFSIFGLLLPLSIFVLNKKR